MQISINTENDMIELGHKIAGVLENKDIVYLFGELGAGKTTLARGIAQGQGYTGTVTSPTFTLMNVYQADLPVYHLDFYRLEGNELNGLGLEDYLEREGISLIEWPEIGAGYLPAEALIVNIELINDDYDRERMVTISAQGKRYEEKVKELEKQC